jgi:NifU-like protein involved in Fe-S cluster formation
MVVEQYKGATQQEIQDHDSNLKEIMAQSSDLPDDKEGKAEYRAHTEIAIAALKTKDALALEVHFFFDCVR